MSNHCMSNPRSKLQDRSQPAILRRKRKADWDSEEKLQSSEECKSGNKVFIQMESDSSTSATLSEESPPSERKKHISNVEKSPDVLVVRTVSQFRGLVARPTLKFCCHRKTPLPKFSWAEAKEVWEHMIKKDAIYVHDHTMFSRHPALQAKMRAILLDWIIEVCEVYRLHRETFYLAQDFIDRYLGKQCNVPKQQLQLLGITSLFVASKIEEIYPPKLSDFAYVTDGACEEKEILEKELVILKVLNWDLMPMTLNNWLSVCLQLASSRHQDDNFLTPDISGHTFVQIVQLLDLCILDIGCLQFPYCIVVTSALYYMLSEQVALSVSGLTWLDIEPCVKWMAAFAAAVRETGGAELRYFHKVPHDDMHNIQTHVVSLELLETAQSRQSQYLALGSGSPSATIGILTPPQSNEKVPGVTREETEHLP